MVRLLEKHPMPVNELIASVAHLVPPGKAYRRYISKGYRTRVTQEHAIASGSIDLVRGSIHSMTQSGSFRQFELDGQVYIEITDLGKRRLGKA